MAIAYPIILPASPSVRIASWHADASSSITESPFTGEQQVQSYDAQRLVVECELPPMSRAEAEEWVGAFLSMYGAYGRCMFGDTASALPRGTAYTGGSGWVHPGQVGKSVLTSGWNVSQTALLMRGDWIQILPNLLTNPNAFNLSPWVAFDISSVSANSQTDPLSGTTADRATPDAGGGGSSYLRQSVASTLYAGRTYGFSVWLKAASGTPTIAIRILNSGGGDFITPALTTCVLSTSWQKFTVTFVPTQADEDANGVGSAMCVQVGGGSGSIAWSIADGPVDLYGASFWTSTHSGRLHKIVKQAAVDSFANPVTLEIYGGLHDVSKMDFAPIKVGASPQGEFRLVADDFTWSIDNALKYGMKFTLAEAY